MGTAGNAIHREPWNEGKLVGQKAPFNLNGTDSMRRTKATLIYLRTKNLRAVRLLLGRSKLESTVRCLGIEVDDALEISEQTEIRGRRRRPRRPSVSGRPPSLAAMWPVDEPELPAKSGPRPTAALGPPFRSQALRTTSGAFPCKGRRGQPYLHECNCRLNEGAGLRRRCGCRRMRPKRARAASCLRGRRRVWRLGL